MTPSGSWRVRSGIDRWPLERRPAGTLHHGSDRFGLNSVRRFPDRIGQGQQIIRIRRRRPIRHRQPQHFPASGYSQPVGMLRTQIVTMRFGIGREGAQDCGGIGIHVRQSRHCRLLAAGP